MKIIEIEAKNIVLNYDGANNQILNYKLKFLKNSKFNLSKTQSEYVLKYHQVIPKVAKKEIKLLKLFAEKLKEEQNLIQAPLTLWCEKMLCESDKAYHIYGKFNEEKENRIFWLPKAAILREQKKLNRVVDYSIYNNRPPMEHQKLAIETLLANDRFILADAPGVGKTGSAIIASLESKAKKVLIVCPATLKLNWKRELEYYTNRRILIVEDGKWGSTFDFYIINFDILKNYHSLEKNENGDYDSLILKENFDLAIIDEAHVLSNSQTIRTKILNSILEKIPKVWLLTGTPITNRPINLFNLLNIVKSPLATNWQNYVIRYCKGFQHFIKGSKKKIWNTSGSSNLDELREGIKDVILRRLKEDILDLPDKIITPILLELNNKLYTDEIEELIKIKKEQKENTNLSITINRLMGLRKILANEKIKYTCELADKHLEMGQKIIIFTNFTDTLETLHEYFGKQSVILDGRMTKNNRQISVDKFQTDPKIKVFISNIKAGGVGITLTESEVTIMNDLSFVPSDHAQAEDRSFRIGVKKNVIIYYPIFENTIDKLVYNILNKKKNIIDQVMGEGDWDESLFNELLENIT